MVPTWRQTIPTPWGVWFQVVSTTYVLALDSSLTFDLAFGEQKGLHAEKAPYRSGQSIGHQPYGSKVRLPEAVQFSKLPRVWYPRPNWAGQRETEQ